MNIAGTGFEQCYFIYGCGASNNFYCTIVQTDANGAVLTNLANATISVISAGTGWSDAHLKLKFSTQYFRGSIISNLAFNATFSNS